MIGALQLVESDNCAKSHHQAVEGLLHRLRHNADEARRVLLLISNGDSTSIVVQALSQLTADQLATITVAQAQDHHGLGDNNYWSQFTRTFGGIRYLAGVLPILQEGNTLSETVNNYDLELTTLIKESDYSIAVLDIDDDGGLAGMRPGDALQFQKFFGDDFITGYETESGGCVTITDYGLKVLSDIMIFACGPEKQKALADMHKHRPVHKQPAQLLKIYDRVTVYTTKA